MATSCLLRSTHTGAITVPQFMDALHRTWLESRRFRPGTISVRPRRLGVAVSGGADSMALAYLCRQWEIQKQEQKQTHIRDVHGRDEVSVTAFVVDHKARQESTQEANTVADCLRELGVTTQILPLDWTGVSLSAFETQARRLRFQVLGKACRDRGIEALLMGHHQDDNVETTIWRLCSGARGAGLAGISAVARIPECHGLHGVSGSGETVTVHPGDFQSQQGHPEQQKQSEQRSSVDVSTGGILICRPLLSFPKSSLVATCHENKVPFVSDPTNFDPTLTPRNAIRSLLSSNSLPRALQNPSILSLIEKCQNLIRDSHRLSDEILESQCRLLDVSLASGSLTVQFRYPLSSPSKPPSQEYQHQEISTQRFHELQCLTLRRITELVSPFPENHFPLSSFDGFTSRIFPSSIPSSTSSVTEQELEEGTKPKERKSFTLGGVLFHPLSSSNAIKKTPSVTANATNTIRHNNDVKHAAKWLLTRQPYMRRRDPILHFNLPIPHFPAATDVEKQFHIPWTLWDNRFWIRASLNPPRPRCDPFQSSSNLYPGKEEQKSATTSSTPMSPSPPALTASKSKKGCPEDERQLQLIIRPLRQSDLSALRRRHAKKPKTKEYTHDSIHESEGKGAATFDVVAFFAKLDREAPGQSRFTVPVLAVGDGGTGGEIDVPLALPTLDLTFPVLDSRRWTITWNWKYKMVDLESLKLMGSA
ncbi:PP-loop family-domain-containing protein [Aspergillus aurantiobrunneus]